LLERRETFGCSRIEIGWQCANVTYVVASPEGVPDEWQLLRFVVSGNLLRENMAPRGPKEKRRNSEKRKEKSREAARCRRSKESEIFSDLADLLPVSPSLSVQQLDKASIMRLTIAYLKARNLLQASGMEGDEAISLGDIQLDDGKDYKDQQDRMEDAKELDSLLPKALHGVFFALSSDGDIIYTGDNVNQQLGLAQVYYSSNQT